jgi:hypothetical protein
MKDFMLQKQGSAGSKVSFIVPSDAYRTQLISERKC